MPRRNRPQGNQSTDAWRDAIGKRSPGVWVDVAQKRTKGQRLGKNQWSDKGTHSMRATIQAIGAALWREWQQGEEAPDGPRG